MLCNYFVDYIVFGCLKEKNKVDTILLQRTPVNYQDNGTLFNLDRQQDGSPTKKKKKNR